LFQSNFWVIAKVGVLSNVVDLIMVLQVFAASYRTGEIAPGGNSTQSWTMEAALCSIGQTMASMGAQDSHYTMQGQMQYCIQQQLKGYARQDSPAIRVKPIPFTIITHTLASAHSTMDQASTNLATIGFFFLLWPGKQCLLTTGRHTAGAIQQQKRELELLFLEHQQRIYIINGEELEAVDHFKYLGCPISTTGLDWPAVQYSINKAHQQWARISKILTWQGSRPKVMGYYYKMVCQAMLLYSCETWVITQAIYNKLESFHHHVARQISRKRQEYLLPWARERPLLQQSKQLGRGFGDMSPLLEVLCDQ
jgi:hypothetical protein